MARIKGGLNAKKKHNRVLSLQRATEELEASSIESLSSLL